MLVDRFGRRIEYLRVSVTDKCDLRCVYCLPKRFKDFSEPREWLTFDEITRVVRVFSELGTRHVRLTGGEPLLRRHLPALAARLSALPYLQDLSLTTNGTQLGRLAGALKHAGVHRLNVSLDGLEAACVQKISGKDSLDKVLAGLYLAKKAGFEKIKINMVPIQGVNEDQIEKMIDFCQSEGFILRLIEAMPMGETGQKTRWLNLLHTVETLAQRFQLTPDLTLSQQGAGPARYWSNADKHFSLGLITPLSQHFCESCNRVRLSVEGVLYLCLGQNEAFDLKPFLRHQTCSDAELKSIIQDAINLKPERHTFNEAPQKIIRLMSMTGG